MGKWENNSLYYLGKKSQLIETDAHTMEIMRVADTDVTTAVM